MKMVPLAQKPRVDRAKAGVARRSDRVAPPLRATEHRGDSDGITWRQETEAAPWHPRLWFSTAVYRNRLWLLGGWSNGPSRNWNDVWHTRNGRDWHRLETPTGWSPRHEHSTFVFRDRLWVAGGMQPPLANDVWSLHLPTDWEP